MRSALIAVAATTGLAKVALGKPEMGAYEVSQRIEENDRILYGRSPVSQAQPDIDFLNSYASNVAKAVALRGA
jgi:hypothetical protein